MACDSLPLFLSIPLLQSLKGSAKNQTTQTGSYIILAFVSSHMKLGEQSREQSSGATPLTCMACTRKEGFWKLSQTWSVIQKLSLSYKSLQTWVSDIKEKETHKLIFFGWVFSFWPVCRSAGCGRPGWVGAKKWSLKLLPVWPWESEWGDRQLEQLNTCKGRERESKRRRGEEREGQPILTPHLLPPLAPCTAILHSPNPLSLTPQDANSWSAARIPKFQICPNRGPNNNSQIHTLAPTSSYPMPPLTGPTTHLVSFKLNPRKSPKLSPPSSLPFPIYPTSIYTYLPHLLLFFSFLFHKATKAFALVQSDMQDIYSLGERS